MDQLNAARKQLSAIALDVLIACKTPDATARRIVDSLMLSDDRGAHTHGLSLLPLYCELISGGVIDPSAQPTLVADEVSGTARVTGNRAFGQLSAEAAVDAGLDMLNQHGVVAVGIEDGTHLGRLGEWAERACAEGAAFLAFTNTAGGALNVAGPGGSNRVMSTNPLAIGIPTFGAIDYPIVIDFASSQVSGSRIREIANAGGKLDPDWVVASDPERAQDPFEFLSGHSALRPLGGIAAGHKGFGLMVASELLAALAGSLIAGEREQAYFSNGALFLLLDISRFSPESEWGERMAHFRDYLDGLGYRLPGSRRSEQADDATVQIAPHVLAALLKIAQDMHVDTRGLSVVQESTRVTRTW